jgi:hypothetical protein
MTMLFERTSTMRIVGGWMSEDGRETRWGTALESTETNLQVASLGQGWDAGDATTFVSGAGPIAALHEAEKAIAGGSTTATIRCVDPLRTGYDRAERDRLMNIFDPVGVPEAYTLLARTFCEREGISEAEFRRVARALEANYRETAVARGVDVAPSGTHDVAVTDWFRRVDCANPNIDFACEIYCASDDVAETLAPGSPKVLSVAVQEVEDGPSNVSTIARFEHLAAALNGACSLADTSVEEAWNCGALEVYTCFPIVPLAFLLTSGLARDADMVIDRLGERPITCSGGMTLARAPWNGPALRGLMLVAGEVARGAPLGLVHGNGGLGGKQGIAVVGRSD